MAAAASSTQHFTTNDGVQLAYESAGSSGPVVVLIHGWSGSRKYFQCNMPALAASCQVTDSLSSLMIGPSDKD
jgi:pimeloyl-ACP methyl ester carboxylesterase